MLISSIRLQIPIGLILAALLFVTREQHFATLHSLPSASWAVFFLAGVYLRPAWVFSALFVFTWGIDFAPHLLSGASLTEIVSGGKAFCLTPAYFFLLPAYGALWLAGRWYAGRYRFSWTTLAPLAFAVIISTGICEVISSGSFYFFSGRFAEPTFTEFGGRLLKYFPYSLSSIVFYVGIATAMHALWEFAQQRRSAYV